MSYLPTGATPAWMQTLPRTLDPTLHNLELAMRANGSSEQNIMQMKMQYILQHQHDWTKPLKSNTTVKYLAFNTFTGSENTLVSTRPSDNQTFYDARWKFHQPQRILRFAVMNLRAIVMSPMIAPTYALMNKSDSTGTSIVNNMQPTLAYSSDGGNTWTTYTFQIFQDTTGTNPWYYLPGALARIQQQFLASIFPTVTIAFDGYNLTFVNTSSTVTFMLSFADPNAVVFRRMFQRTLVTVLTSTAGVQRFPFGSIWPLAYYLAQKPSYGGLDVSPGSVDTGTPANVFCMIPPQIGYGGSPATEDARYGPPLLSYDTSVPHWVECSDRPMNELAVGLLNDALQPELPGSMAIMIAIEVIKE